jgi:metalloendopeptidase OMA1, mitochondrial
MQNKIVFTLLFACLCGVLTVYSQNPCKAPGIVFNRNAENIFDENQEMFLGEVMAETLEKEFRVIRDEEVNRYVRAVGEKLVRHLPPTNIKFQFFVVDVPDVNAFAVAGGRIYVTRKLIAFVKSEDELAGIIGHELGHAIVRHHSADMSKYFKEVLGVEKVGDRKDIFEKYNQLLDRQNTKRVKIKKSHEGDQQLEADRIGLFAMIAAGYDPRGYTSAWERLTENKKTGNAWTDFFGTTRPEEKRLREMLKAIAALPAECVDKKEAAAGENFARWQSFVVTTSSFPKTEKLKSLLVKKSLNPFLRGDIKHFQFSPDGKYILAQDASGINVLRREPFGFLYRIEIEDAKFANFSPDSRHIVFQTYGLRVEKWSVADQKPVLAREVYVNGDCWQTALSPDGKYLICYSSKASLDIVDVETNEKIVSKEKFYVPSYFEYISWTFALIESGEKEITPLQMEFSPDGKYFLAGRVFRFSTGSSSSVSGLFFMFWNYNADQDAFIAFDFQQKKEIKLGGELRNIVAMPFAFYANDKIIGQHRKDPEKSGIFTFPGGERVEKFFMNANSYTKPHQGDYIFIRPTAKNPVGVYDLQTKKFIASNKTPALDGYGDYFVSEGRDGIIDLHKIDKAGKTMQEAGNTGLPKNNLGDVRTVAVSPDFNWLALSEKSRGAVWNLKTGEMSIYIRGFRGSHFEPDGSLYADFPFYEQEPRTMGVMNPANKNAAQLQPIETRNTKQFGKFLVRMKTKFDERLQKQAQQAKAKAAGQNADEEEKKKPKFEFTDGFLTGLDLSGGFAFENGTLEVSDARTRKLLWSKAFPNEAPQYRFDATSETVALYWSLTTKAAKNEIKNKPPLAARLKTLGEKQGDYLVQVLDANTGNLIGETLIETGEGSFQIENVFASGDWLTIIDSENRVLLYSLAKGELQWRFFGDNAAVSPEKSLAAVENIPGQLSIYNLKTGQKTDELQFTSGVVYAVFSRDGKKLFVLTANQNYYLFNAEGFAVPQ